MALIFCPECGNQVSEFAEMCNKCSYPIAKRKLGTLRNEPTPPEIQYSQQAKHPEIDYSPKVKQTDPLAVVAFAAGLGGFVILPILFIPIGYIAGIVSYYRLKENSNLKGKAMRLIGAILTSINILWLIYQNSIE